MEIAITPVLVRASGGFSTAVRMFAAEESAEGDYPVNNTAPGYEFRELDVLCEQSQVHAFATYGGKEVPGHAHLTLPGIQRAQTEDSLAFRLVEYLENIRETIDEMAGEDVPMVLVAHNAHTFDGDLLHRCLTRNGIDSRAEFERLRVTGVIDTLPISKRLDWEGFISSEGASAHIRRGLPTFELPPIDAKLPYAYARALPFINTIGKPSSASEVERQQAQREAEPAEQQQNRAADGNHVPALIDEDDHSGSDGDAADDAIGVLVKGRPTTSLPSKKALSHALSSVYERIFHTGFEAHIASDDVSALVEIVQHPLFWRAIVNQEVVSSWQHLANRYDTLHSQHEADVLGWTLEHCPRCNHDSMIPRLVEMAPATSQVAATASATGNIAAVIAARWKVVLSCRVHSTEPACRAREVGVRDGYTPATEPSTKATGKPKTKPKEVAVSEGACACTTKCARNTCPCKRDGRPCEPARCYKHATAACKCTNM